MQYIYVLQCLFYKFMMFPKHDCGKRWGGGWGGEAWNLLPRFLCFGNTNVYTAVLFQIVDSESSVPVSF